MKTSAILTAVAGAAIASAQLNQIPTCALSCAISSIGGSGCAQTDIACICSASSFLTGILSCIQGSCSPAEIQQTLAAAQVLCADAGVTITVPGGTPATTTSAAPAPPTTTAAPEPEPTTTEAETETTTSVTPSLPSEVPSEVPYTSTSSVVTMTTYTTVCPTTATYVAPPVTTATYVAPPVTTATYVAPPVNNATATYVAPPAYTGAAGNVAANAGSILVGAALAMLFA
jgi:hypothetical protein